MALAATSRTAVVEALAEEDQTPDSIQSVWIEYAKICEQTVDDKTNEANPQFRAQLQIAVLVHKALIFREVGDTQRYFQDLRDAEEFVLNLPWTLLDAFAALVSIPKSISVNSRPLCFVVKVRSFWWYTWLPSKAGVRAITNGHLIQLEPLEQKKDLDHELIHVEQATREPLIYPILYLLENFRRNYRVNKYEAEAYRRAGNRYEN